MLISYHTHYFLAQYEWLNRDVQKYVFLFYFINVFFVARLASASYCELRKWHSVVDHRVYKTLRDGAISIFLF